MFQLYTYIYNVHHVHHLVPRFTRFQPWTTQMPRSHRHVAPGGMLLEARVFQDVWSRPLDRGIFFQGISFHRCVKLSNHLEGLIRDDCFVMVFCKSSLHNWGPECHYRHIPFLNQGPVLFIAYVAEMFFFFEIWWSLPGMLKPVGNREKKTTSEEFWSINVGLVGTLSSKTSLCLGKVASMHLCTTYGWWKKSCTTWDV